MKQLYARYATSVAKGLMIILMLVGMGKVEGQPILNASDVNPIIGDFILMVRSSLYYDNVNVKVPISNGKNLIWDYGYLHDSSFGYWFKRYPTNGFLYSYGSQKYYPQNLPNGNSINYYAYYSIYFINLDNITNTSWNYAGAYESYPSGSIDFTYKDSLFKPLPRIIYPLSYGINYIDSTTSKELNTSGVYGNVKVYDTVSCKAYGTLILPDVTYDSVLLVKHTFERHNLYDNYSYSNVEYLFMVKGVHGPVLKIYGYGGSLAAEYYVRNVVAGLPVKLINISAYEINKAAVINWQTATEVNTSHFIVEQSSDGKIFIAKGTVKAVGSGANSYAFDVPFSSPSGDKGGPGVRFFRLKMFDKDGSFTYSKIVSVQLTINNSQLTISPNPAKDFTTVSIHLSKAQTIQYQLINTEGKQCSVQKQALPAGISSFQINLKGLAKGIYWLKIEGVGEKQLVVE